MAMPRSTVIGTGYHISYEGVAKELIGRVTESSGHRAKRMGPFETFQFIPLAYSMAQKQNIA